MIKNNIINLLKKIRGNKYVHYFVIIIIGIILSIPLCNIQIKDTHDGSIHMLRLVGTLDSLKINQFPPLINQNFCNGAGYSMNLFYPPLVTYIPLVIKIFTSSYFTCLKIFGAICIVISGITMYKCTYQITENRIIAFFSAVFYLIAPYKLANVYKRYAIGEFFAMSFIPLVFLGVYNLFNGNKKKHYYIVIGAIGLILSHTVTTLYTAMFCVIYMLFNFKKLKDKEILKKCIINVIFILLVSIMFWLPMLEATSNADYVIMDDDFMRTNGIFASQNTISFSQLFKDKNEENQTTYLLGIPTILAMILTLFVYKKVDKKYKEIYLIFLIFSLISVFMVSRFFPWKIMPNIVCKLQYPWRMLGFLNFFGSIICSVNLYYFIKQMSKKENIKTILAIIFIILSVTDSIFIMSRFYTKDRLNDEKYEDNILKNKKISCMQINRDYMPIKSINNLSYVLTREDKTYILEGEAEIIKEEKNELQDLIEIKNIKEKTILEFPYYYYVGYEITINNNGKIVKANPIESENGYISCMINENIENANIKVKYVGTIIEKASYIVSAISFIIFIVYIINEEKRGEKNGKSQEDIKK